jgi:hypothetical protein
MKRRIQFAFEALTAIEFIIYVVLAAALVLVGPGIWIYRLITADRMAPGIIVAMLWIVSVAAVIREVRRGAITALSLGIFLTWLVMLVYVFRGIFV